MYTRLCAALARLCLRVGVGGLVRGILHLGKKWCYKEVSAG